MRLRNLGGALGLLALTALDSPSHQSADIPLPATEAMEPQVAAKMHRLRQAVATDPRSASAWGSLGRTFHAHGLEEEAERSYRRAAELDPDEFRWPYLLAVITQTTRTEEALALAERATLLNPRFAPAYVLAAELLERLDESTQAEARYEKAAAAASRCAAAELGLGRLLLSRGELEGAARHLELAASYQPRAAPIHAALARLHARRGDRTSAEREARLARSLPAEVSLADPVMIEVTEEAVSSRGYEKRAMRAEAAGDVAKAESLYRRILELRPDDTRVLFNFGNLYVRQGDFGRAIETYRRTLELDPKHVAAQVNLGNALVMMGQLDEGMSHLRAAIQRAPGDADAHRSLGRILAYRGDFASAIVHFRATLERAPDDGQVHRDLAIALAREGEFEAAWSHVTKAERLGAKLPEEFLARLRAVHPRD